MKRIAVIAAAVIVLVSAIGAGAALYLRPNFLFGAAEPADAPKPNAADDAPSPESLLGTKRRAVTLVEKLGVVQDRIVRGDRSALIEQKHLLAETGAAIRYLEKRDWQDFANVRASLLYVLSGGDPSVLKPFIAGGAGSEADRTLADGIAHFAKGHKANASKLVENVDPRTLDASLIGPFALARGSLLLSDKPAAAIAYLDEARLASPHTAIEEAALRREIPLLVAAGQIERANAMMADYAHRFGQSIYARKFFSMFASALANRGDLDEKTTFEGIVRALNPKDAQANSDLLLEVASQALLHGRLGMARRAAAAILQNAATRPEGLETARLYQAAADAPSGRAGEAARQLANIAAEKLSTDDGEILDAARYVAREVAGNETADSRLQSAGQNELVATPTANESSPISQDLIRISGALQDADAAMKRVDRLAPRAAN